MTVLHSLKLGEAVVMLLLSGQATDIGQKTVSEVKGQYCKVIGT